MTLCFLCAYAFLCARSHPVGGADVRLRVPVRLGRAGLHGVARRRTSSTSRSSCSAYFFWCYKEVGRAGRGAATAARGGRAGCWRTRSDVVAAALLGIATFSKPTHVLLIAPLLASALLREPVAARPLRIGSRLRAGRRRRCSALNIAVTGEWNYQGGDRKTFYSGDGRIAAVPVPERAEHVRHRRRSTARRRRSARRAARPRRARATCSATTSATSSSAGTPALPLFLPGRDGDPAVPRRHARSRDVAMADARGAASAPRSCLLLYMPFTYSGGGGPVGNRYFLGIYARVPVPGAAAADRGRRTDRDGDQRAVHGADPVEPVLRVDPSGRAQQDRPVRLAADRADAGQRPAGERQPVATRAAARRRRRRCSAYFLDDNAYNREGDAFWVRGESRADIMLRAPIGTETQRRHHAGAVAAHRTKLTVHLETGPEAESRRDRRPAAKRASSTWRRASQQTFELAMPHGVPYRSDPRFPTNYVYSLSRSRSSTGFMPMFENGTHDSRFLGVMVRLDSDLRRRAVVATDCRRHVEPAVCRGRTPGDGARAGARAARRRSRRRA